MATVAINSKQQAHELIERMSTRQVSAVVGLLEAMLDPVSNSLAGVAAKIPYEDEEISEEENRAVATSKAWLKDHNPIPNEEVLAEFGLTAEDFERMGRMPLEPEQHPLGQ